MNGTKNKCCDTQVQKGGFNQNSCPIFLTILNLDARNPLKSTNLLYHTFLVSAVNSQTTHHVQLKDQSLSSLSHKWEYLTSCLFPSMYRPRDSILPLLIFVFYHHSLQSTCLALGMTAAPMPKLFSSTSVSKPFEIPFHNPSSLLFHRFHGTMSKFFRVCFHCRLNCNCNADRHTYACFNLASVDNSSSEILAAWTSAWASNQRHSQSYPGRLVLQRQLMLLYLYCYFCPCWLC